MFGFDWNDSLGQLEDNGEGMPPLVYTSAEVFDCESQKAIGSMWTCFAPIERLRQVGKNEAQKSI